MTARRPWSSNPAAACSTDPRERGVHVRQQARQLARHGEVLGQQVLGQGQGAAQVGEGDDRQALADERVVRVVPLRALGVHPDAAVGHQVDDLGQDGQQQLLAERHAHEVAVGAVHQPPVGALGRDAPLDPLLRVGVERDRRDRLDHRLVVRRDAVRHVGVREDGPVDERLQPTGVEPARRLQELDQVDHLVVAPVADVRPRVRRLGHLPVDAGARDAVRVVPVGRRRVEEHRDHRLDVLRERPGQRLPVLEDVPPVALEVDARLTAGVGQGDRELVPRPARVAVPAAERQRQVLAHEPQQVRVPGRVGPLDEVVDLLGRGERVEPRARCGPRSAGCARRRRPAGRTCGRCTRRRGRRRA